MSEPGMHVKPNLKGTHHLIQKMPPKKISFPKQVLYKLIGIIKAVGSFIAKCLFCGFRRKVKIKNITKDIEKIPLKPKRKKAPPGGSPRTLHAAKLAEQTANKVKKMQMGGGFKDIAKRAEKKFDHERARAEGEKKLKHKAFVGSKTKDLSLVTKNIGLAFSLKGQTFVGKTKVELEGSLTFYSQKPVLESFNKFLASTAEKLDAALQKNAKKVLDNLWFQKNHKIDSIADEAKSRRDSFVYLNGYLEAGFEGSRGKPGHAVGLIFFKIKGEHFAMRLNRGYDEGIGQSMSGITVMKINENKITSVISDLKDQSKEKWLTVDAFRNKLDAKVIFSHNMKGQSSGNCTYSTQKMVGYGMQVIQDMIDNKTEPTQLNFERTFNKIRPFYKAWTKFDRLHKLKEFSKTIGVILKEEIQSALFLDAIATGYNIIEKITSKIKDQPWAIEALIMLANLKNIIDKITPPEIKEGLDKVEQKIIDKKLAHACLHSIIKSIEDFEEDKIKEAEERLLIAQSGLKKISSRKITVEGINVTEMKKIITQALIKIKKTRASGRKVSKIDLKIKGEIAIKLQELRNHRLCEKSIGCFHLACQFLMAGECEESKKLIRKARDLIKHMNKQAPFLDKKISIEKYRQVLYNIYSLNDLAFEDKKSEEYRDQILTQMVINIPEGFM